MCDEWSSSTPGRYMDRWGRDDESEWEMRQALPVLLWCVYPAVRLTDLQQSPQAWHTDQDCRRISPSIQPKPAEMLLLADDEAEPVAIVTGHGNCSNLCSTKQRCWRDTQWQKTTQIQQCCHSSSKHECTRFACKYYQQFHHYRLVCCMQNIIFCILVFNVYIQLDHIQLVKTVPSQLVSFSLALTVLLHIGVNCNSATSWEFMIQQH